MSAPLESACSIMGRLNSFVISHRPVYYLKSPDTWSIRLVMSRFHHFISDTTRTYYRWLARCVEPLSFQNLYRALFEPRSRHDEVRRREFMVNVLLCGLAIITAVKVLLSFIADLELGLNQEEDSLLLNGIFLLLVLGIWRLSRRGQRQIAAYSLLGLLALEAMRVTLSWSFEWPISELLCAVVIVAAGVVLTARSALIVTGITSLLLLGISHAQIGGHLRPHTYWIQKDFQISDAFGYIAILYFIALITWLTNREVSQSLARAYASEAALAKERDNLEILVAERTRELLESQLLRNMELEHFAEFGRVSANLLHEVTSPLTAASLNLELFDGAGSRTVTRARKNLQQLERYVTAARQQLKTCGKLKNFSIRSEFKRLALVMNPLARQNGVKIIFESTANYKLFGDSVKFNQLLANLVSNAIDAYQGVCLARKQSLVTVKATASNRWLKLTVSDWGKGIPPEAIPRLFQPFYTTKADSERGTGIGLTMVKRVVEDDFGGTITVTSTPSIGTRFVIKLKR